MENRRWLGSVTIPKSGAALLIIPFSVSMGSPRISGIVAKLTGPVKRKISTLSYQVHSSGLETAEFMYQPTRWKKEYRFVVVRRLIPEDPTEQLTLFLMGKYSYQVIVTNMKL